MKRRRALDEETLRERVLHVARENPTLSPVAVGRIVGCSHVTARRVMTANGLVRQLRPAEAPPTGLVAAALAEARAPSKPLVVESLEQKLARLVPGARLENDPRSSTPWAVWRGLSILAAGHSAREAVDRAVMLYGGR